MSDKLAILLYTYNGERFLQKQLASFNSQTFTNWSLFIYDDNSTDNTQSIIKEYVVSGIKAGKKMYYSCNSRRMGITGNFLNSIAHVPDSFEFYAFSDQDDIWDEAKLESAVDYLKNIPSKSTALYCSGSALIDDNGNNIGVYTPFKRTPSFIHSLVENIACGHTMVFNKAALHLMRQVKKDSINMLSPDWFIYQIVVGAGGKVLYDLRNHVLYRQHSTNLIGHKMGVYTRLCNIYKGLKGTVRDCNDKYLKALRSNISLLTKTNQGILLSFIAARNGSFVTRLKYFLQSGMYRRTYFGDIKLFIMWMLKKI